jgi:hypothetical protein
MTDHEMQLHDILLEHDITKASKLEEVLSDTSLQCLGQLLNHYGIMSTEDYDDMLEDLFDRVFTEAFDSSFTSNLDDLLFEAEED